MGLLYGSERSGGFLRVLTDRHTYVATARVDVLLDQMLDVGAEAPVTKTQAPIVGRFIKIGRHGYGDLCGTVIHGNDFVGSAWDPYPIDVPMTSVTRTSTPISTRFEGGVSIKNKNF